MSAMNLLFIMTDQQRWDAMGCAADWAVTPNLDRLAGEGVRFSQCITTTPICVPARVTMATGRYPHNTSVWNNSNYTLPHDMPNWMRAVRDQGYRTSLFGKTHLHPHQGDLREREHLLHAWGLDDVDEIGGPRASAVLDSHMTRRWADRGLLDAYREDFRERFANKPHVARPSVLPLEEYADVYVGQRAKQYLEDYSRDEPWFCWVSFGGPHEPWDTPEPYASRYDPEAMPSPVERSTSDQPRPQGWLDYYMARSSPQFDPGDVSAMRANYAGNVTLIDDQIGEILDAIEARGELDNTAVVFTSDHGEMNGDWGLIYKMNFLDGALRVPLIVRTPQTAASAGGRVVEDIAENADIGPTLAELAGAELGYGQFARSLIPAVMGEKHRDSGLSEFRGEFMLVTDRWKVALNRQGKVYLLFDRLDDPAETRNLAGLPEHRADEDALRLAILERVAGSQLKAP